MAAYQSVTICGNLGRDPEIRYIEGNSVTGFSVAVNETWKDKSGQKQEHTEWFNVDVWGGQAEACAKYLAKGRTVLVNGTLRTREYEKDGEKKRATSLRAHRVVFLGGGPSEKGAPAATDDTDIPF